MPRASSSGRGFSAIFEIEDVPVDPIDEARERLQVLAGKQEHRRIPFRPWAVQVPVSGVGTLDFDLFPFQNEWYDDDIVYRKRGNVMKATQVGASEYMVRWAMFWPDTRGDHAMYVFPASRQLRDFSDTRVKAMIRGSEYLRRRVPYGYIDNKMLKQIGWGYLYFRGSKVESDLESVPADEVVLDENDLLVQRNIPAAEKRLSSPTSRNLLRRIGWPTYTEIGIHAHFSRSDQREWLVKCSKCRKQLPLHFYPQDGRTHHYMDLQRACLVCANCETPIKREWIAKGRWVAEHPDREEFGYHVSRLIVPNADYPALIAESKLTRPYQVETFWRKSLGLPYDTAEGRLSREAINAAISAGGNYMQGPWDAGYEGDALVTAGIDVASVRNLNVRISEHVTETKKRALFIGEVDSFEKLYTMLVAFKVNCAAIDNEPEGRLARALANRLPGIVFLHSWNDQRKQVLDFDEQMFTVSTHRTTLIDATLDSIRQRTNMLPVNIPEDYVDHMRAPVRFQEEDEEDGTMRTGYRIEVAHDYMQAEAYDLAATETWWALHLKGRVQREQLQPLDQIMPFERTHVSEYGEAGYSPGPLADTPSWDEEVRRMEEEFGSE